MTRLCACASQALTKMSGTQRPLTALRVLKTQRKNFSLNELSCAFFGVNSRNGTI